jgi:secreted PhoX family phosphatase
VNASRDGTFPFDRPTRRAVLGGGLAALGLLLTDPRRALGSASPVLRFAPVGSYCDDLLHVPDGYQSKVVLAWGDPLQPGGPAWSSFATASAADQARQAGMHHDALHLFPVTDTPGHHLLVLNHEYTDEGLLHPDGQDTWTRPKTEKSMNAHGVSVVEIRRTPQGPWETVTSPRARRITASTPMRISGPGATRVGSSVRGTLANCAAGQTPWGTFLSCEENFHMYFVRGAGKPSEAEARYGLAQGAGLRWHEFEPRFRVDVEPDECLRFGWVVEIDPYDPKSTPVKRTALGRFRHENAFVRAVVGQPVVVYMGDDEENEHLYKFVSSRPLSATAAENRDLLDEGRLHVARLDDDGTGEWLALEHGKRGLVAPAFPDQASVLTFARLAATRVGATPLDRPEWVAMNPEGRVFVSLTNASDNPYGHILAIDEEGHRGDATRFRHEVFAKGGAAFEVRNSSTNATHPPLGSPDGLACDARGVLWVQTDVSTKTLDRGAYAGFGANQLVAVDPVTLEARRFLAGPKGCEVTGIAFTPDLRVLFVNVQHPGEPPPSGGLSRSDWRTPAKFGSWPASDATSRPRSATVAIWRPDGAPVGS